MSKDRSFWSFAMVALCVLVGVVLLLWLVAPLLGILD
jgi:hypothetical protein